MDVITVSSQRRRQLIDVTGFVAEAVANAALADGLCHVFVPHTTAALLVNENADPDVATDILAALEAMLPDVRFRHAEGNSDAHLLASLVGDGRTLPIRDGELALGRWQGVFLLELDGPRRREVWITCLGTE